MKHIRAGAIALALCAALSVAPGARAAETAPLCTGAEAQQPPRREDLGQVAPFGSNRSSMGIAISDQWMYQARVGGLSLKMGLYERDGKGICFQECLYTEQVDGVKKVRLCLRQTTADGGLLLQLDQHALDVLTRVGITEVIVTDRDYYIQATYATRDLQTLRDALGLAAGEQLCVAGEDAPVTILSVDGVRRQVTQ